MMTMKTKVASPVADVIDLAEWKQALAYHHAHVIAVYKGEITDWCGHDLAVEITAEKCRITTIEVQAIIKKAGNLWGVAS